MFTLCSLSFLQNYSKVGAPYITDTSAQKFQKLQNDIRLQLSTVEYLKKHHFGNSEGVPFDLKTSKQGFSRKGRLSQF